ncbi:MAG: class I SAM-dependent methyltransferase [Ruminococcus sp.]|nr:class I SAM-dependent methyltransferase [Ruminococcus sp.]
MSYFIRQFGDPEGITGRMLGKLMSLSNRKMHRAVLKELCSPVTLLEIGFGAGSQLEMISKRYPGTTLYGIDISKDMLCCAKKRLETRAVLSSGRIEKTDYPDGFFDTVITTDTCYFWTDAVKALNEIKRITKPGGRLIIAYNLLYAAFVHRTNSDCKMYNDAAIIKLCENADMKVLSQRSCGFKQKVFVISIQKEQRE